MEVIAEIGCYIITPIMVVVGLIFTLQRFVARWKDKIKKLQHGLEVYRSEISDLAKENEHLEWEVESLNKQVAELKKDRARIVR